MIAIGEETIREAQAEDIPRIVEIGRKWLAAGPYADQADNPAQAAKFAVYCLNTGKILVGVAGEEIVGVFGFLVFSHVYTGEICAHEMIWYVEPEHRAGGVGVKLFAEAEKLAKSMGALRMQCTAPTVEVGKLYERYGYKQVEIAYERVL